MTEFTGRNKKLYDALRNDPDRVADLRAKQIYECGLADRNMPEEADSIEWAAWVAGRRTRTDRGLS